MNLEKTGPKLGNKDFLLAFYVFYMLNYFKTTFYIHHPIEIWLQGKNMNSYFKHPISSGENSSKVCPLGNHVGVVLAIYLIIRYYFKANTLKYLNCLIWTSVLGTSLVLNLNVFIYLFPAYLIDKIS